MSTFVVVNDHLIVHSEKLPQDINQSSVYIIWHDAYCEWQILTDNLRQTQENCRWEGWGDTIIEAFENRKRRDKPRRKRKFIFVENGNALPGIQEADDIREIDFMATPIAGKPIRTIYELIET